MYEKKHYLKETFEAMSHSLYDSEFHKYLDVFDNDNFTEYGFIIAAGKEDYERNGTL